ncbi:uncharacterized protein LOC135824402 [Sycon ciliatum]|uniref:uncharacterized protein LOC135824402 n=1 Tax=Sycon ciliatum TaxID=27933 RepID=UPI0031F680F6
MGAYGDQEQYGAEPFDAMSDKVAVEDLEDVHDVGKIRLSVGGTNDLENGALFTHWESSTCNEGSHLAYSGFTPSKSIPAFHSQNDNTPVCALRQSSGRSAQFMFPAHLTCPDGWTKEYDGYLMTAKYDHQRTEYICMDKQPEVMEDTSKNVNGALLYFVDTNSRAHVPNAYVCEKELTCSACSSC